MIRKLKLRFMILCMISLFALLAVIVVGMNVINYTTVVRDADDILSLLSENRGIFPELGRMPDDIFGKAEHRFPDMSPELPYESRYFSVVLDNRGAVIFTDTSRIVAVDSESAADMAREIYDSGETQGFSDNLRYCVTEEENRVRIIFLDCTRPLDSARNFLIISITMALVGFALVSVVIFVLSGRILRPIIESHEKQKRFITDAGHEIKTPITIINANIHLMELESDGDNEALGEIKQQTRRLATLTEELVYLARMEEGDGSLKYVEFPLSETVTEMAASFRTLAQMRGKSFECTADPSIFIKGDIKAMERLVSVLMDNAVKYSGEGGSIRVGLIAQNKNAVLTVENTTDRQLSKEELQRIFDRFYRSDPSRSSELGGHGIGLSVAKAVALAHGGRIRAYSHLENTFAIEVILPLA